MATLQDLKTQLGKVNDLGRQNLADKYVDIAKNATTANIMSAIADIVVGARYKQIYYNTDDTITLRDDRGIEHIMNCRYIDGKLVALSYDDTIVDLNYKGDQLVSINESVIVLTHAPSSGV
jgi:hypothetical protein